MRTPANNRRAAQGSRVSLAMTPMIDVVFLLLVFFVCTVRFERREEVYQLDLPARAVTADPLALQESPLQLRVGVRAGDHCALELSADGIVRTAASFDELAKLLEQLQRHDGEGLFERSHPVLVVPAPDCQWQDAVDAFNAAVRAGYANIGFAETGA
ncbi:MAG: hypothetical protein EXS17_03100 [Phycisphaerales bacterium]|nr:hypothetical protein [Phycisphaerales bacterium]